MISFLSALLFGVMLTGAAVFALGFYSGAQWKAHRDAPPAPRLAMPTRGAVAAYTLPREDFDQFCARTDWCAGHLGHDGECFTSPLGDRPR